MKLPCRTTIAILYFFGVALQAQTTSNKRPETAQNVTVCELVANRAAYNHKLIEVTGDASHGFEDSGFSSPECDSRFRLWMTYGGTITTRTASTVNELNPTRRKPITVEGITVPLVKDAAFQRFDALLHEPRANGDASLVHATVIARFFAGNSQGLTGPGYGHLGCCSLFVIQQVVKVYENTVPGLDPSDTPELPDASVFSILGMSDTSQPSILKAQRSAEAGNRAYAFTDPLRVASEAILSNSKTIDPKMLHLNISSSSPYRVVYNGWLDGEKKSPVMVIVSRPAWLSTYAADPAKIAWVVIAAYRIGT